MKVDRELIIEAIFEDLEAKEQLFSKLDQIMPKDTIFTTNSSYLDPRDIIPKNRQNLAAGLHFFSPAHIMKLLEIVSLPKTNPQVMSDLFAFAQDLKKLPVSSGICEGYIGNRILSAYRRQADYLLADGSSVLQIDEAMKIFGMPKGPYELQDMTGLQLAWATRKAKIAKRDPKERYIPFADALCETGHFGQKVGLGWYDYGDVTTSPKQNPNLDKIIKDYRNKHQLIKQSFSQEEIQNRLIAVMANESSLIVEEGIAQKASDVDVIEVAGFGFPRWLGGPLHYANHNLEEICHVMEGVIQQSPNSWKVSKLLSKVGI